MGANCVCLRNRTVYSEILFPNENKPNYFPPISFTPYFNPPINNTSNNNTFTIDKIIKIQSIFKGYLYRQRYHFPLHLLPLKTQSINSKSNQYKEITNSKINQSDLYILMLKLPALTDGITVEIIQLLFPNLAEYRGEWNPTLRERHGRGIQLWTDNTIYKGLWKNDKINGKGRIELRNGEYYEGDFVNDKAEGFGVYQHNDGCKYIGNWKNNLQNGKGKMLWNNNEQYEGDFLKGKMNGKGRFEFMDGSVYDGDFVNDEIIGKGIKTWGDKRIYQGGFKNGKLEGEGEFKWPDGRLFKGHYINDQKNGYGEFYWPNGKIYKGYWKDGKQNGNGEVYIVKDKRWKKGKWDNGKRVSWENN